MCPNIYINSYRKHKYIALIPYAIPELVLVPHISDGVTFLPITVFSQVYFIQT